MNKQNNIPKLRFPEFKGEFSEYRLSELMDRYSQNNKDEEFGIDDILSLSSTFGIVDRKELLEDTYDKVNHKNYKKTRLNDFVYGKSISASFPYGLFKVNNCRDGLLSSLYFTFKVYKNINPSYLDIYFSYQNRANNFLKRFVLVGDRYITADANYLLSGKISIPTLPEQTRIASFFTTIDQKLSQLKQKKTLLEQYKKGVMQKLFSQELRFKDVPSTSSDTGVAAVEPVEPPKWEKKKLGEIAKFSKGKGISKAEISEDGEYECIRYGELYTHYGETIIEIQSRTDLKEKELVFSENNDVIIPASGESQIDIAKASCVLKSGVALGGDINIIKGEFDGIFLSYYLNHKKRNEIATLAQGVSVVHLYSSQLSTLELQLPSLKEQNLISKFISVIENKINRTENQIQQTQEWKKGLLQRMFV